jgi:hypothetical protein
MKKIPTFEEFQGEIGPEAMSFFMEMVRQDSPDEEENEPAKAPDPDDRGTSTRKPNDD